MINLEIDKDSVISIQASFDRIAKDLIHNWNLMVNNEIYSFTEIEFYYFFKGTHDDMAVHEHKVYFEYGYLRHHSKGLDITFKTTEDSDGGILIRGLKKHNEHKNYYFNGPLRVLEEIFISFGSINKPEKIFGLKPKQFFSNEQVFKTIRFGLSEKQPNAFKDNLYRYFIDIDHWDKKHITKSQRESCTDLSILLV
jgi:hypothetical protein